MGQCLSLTGVGQSERFPARPLDLISPRPRKTASRASGNKNPGLHLAWHALVPRSAIRSFR
eukprot:scaffold26474_cov36-Phaeocystis_antarctica.AAC.1